MQSGNRAEERESIDAEAVAALARMVGVEISDDRLPTVAETLRTLHARAAELDDIDLEGSEPAMRFDATWPERGA